MRRCSNGHWTFATDFASNAAREDGLSNLCRSCDAKRNRDKYRKQREAKRVGLRV